MSAKDELMNSTDWAMEARTRLARRRAEKPATKAGQIRALWPDIEAALDAGQSVKTTCTWLEEEAGITLGVTSLTSYVSRIRRREAHRRAPTPARSQQARYRWTRALRWLSRAQRVLCPPLTHSPTCAPVRRRILDFITVRQRIRTRKT